jgi:hypothetical protein
MGALMRESDMGFDWADANAFNGDNSQIVGSVRNHEFP